MMKGICVMIFDIITFIIAIVSFGLSLWNFIETRLNNRVNLSVECKDFVIAEHFPDNRFI